jgi:hypothetical protein
VLLCEVYNAVCEPYSESEKSNLSYKNKNVLSTASSCI